MTDPDLTWPQLLVAYADGVLDGAARRRVEEWLRQHPEAATDLDAQRALSPRNARLWAAVEPPIPTESRWNDVRFGIERRLLPSAVMPRRRPSRNHWLRRGLMLAALAVTGATAAAVLVAVLPPRHVLPPVPTARTAFDIGDDVLAVTRPEDVDIVSIRHADSSNLVVGQPPVRERLVLASAGDVTLGIILPDADGNMPLIQMEGPDGPGILVTPRSP